MLRLPFILQPLMRYLGQWFFYCIPLSFVWVSCMKENEQINSDPNASLLFSTDTVYFDTIFTGIGSITQRVVITNPNAQLIQIDRIQLHGINSPYEIIANGRLGPDIHSIQLRGKDSIYLLVKVTIDPTLQSTPILVTDSIKIEWNSRQAYIQLEAYGQDAYWHNKETISTSTTWNADKPHVLLDTSIVSSGATLTIAPGARIFAHAASGLTIAGNLIADGSTDSIVFSTDRPQPGLSAGLWSGIVFESGSSGNLLHRVSILHAAHALHFLGQPDSDTLAEITLRKCRLTFASQDIIRSVGADWHIENCWLGQTPKSVLRIEQSDVVCLFSTVENYSINFFREAPILQTTISGKFYLINSILYGDRTEELFVYAPIHANHSIVRTATAYINTNSFNTNPKFASTNQLNFTLMSDSPALNVGNSLYFLTDDLNQKIRTLPGDLGCYEK